MIGSKELIEEARQAYEPLRKHYNFDRGSFYEGYYIARLKSLVEGNEIIHDVMPLLPDFRAIRKQKGLTLKDVEKATGMHNGYLSQLESGKIKSPAYDTVRKLHHFYNEA
jgi:hypothetical protein